MTQPPQTITFTAQIGVEVKGETWSCVEMPESAAFFGTKKSQRANITVDDLAIEHIGFMVTGRGGHMFSLNAGLRKKLGKDIGDVVTVTVTKAITPGSSPTSNQNLT